jgi:hypothetical protein
MSRDIPVGTASCYGLDGRGSNPGRGRGFPYSSRLTLASHLHIMSRVKRPGCDINHTQSSRVVVKERVELYIHFLLLLRAGFRVKFVFKGK